METLEISKENAVLAHQEANDKGKKLLENLFGKKVFLKTITERVQTFEDALEETGESISNFKRRTEDHEPDTLAYEKIKVIVKALNAGWTPNWDNGSEYKYFPYFDMRSGSGFSYATYAYWYSITIVGSRLCFKSSELAKYAGTQFTDIYKAYFTI